jgi:hypothetical protein
MLMCISISARLRAPRHRPGPPVAGGDAGRVCITCASIPGRRRPAARPAAARPESAGGVAPSGIFPCARAASDWIYARPPARALAPAVGADADLIGDPRYDAGGTRRARSRVGAMVADWTKRRESPGDGSSAAPGCRRVRCSTRWS